MNYKLSFSFLYDDLHWNRNTYREDKKKHLLMLIKKHPEFRGRYLEGYEHVEFPMGSPELVRILKQECKTHGFLYDMVAFPNYSGNDIRSAKYLPFCTSSRYKRTDIDDDGVPYNTYSKRKCNNCYVCDLDKVPSPYRISQNILDDKREISSESNGIFLLADWLYEEIRSEIEPWIIHGDIEFAETEKITKRYKWIRPRNKVGAFVDSKVSKRCDTCQQAIEIRKERSEDIFKADKWIVESFLDTQAPIVLAGNWFGEIHPGGMVHVTQYVFINNALHEKIQKINPKAFHEAEYAIHAADDPYDWDPLKDMK